MHTPYGRSPVYRRWCEQGYVVTTERATIRSQPCDSTLSKVNESLIFLTRVNFAAHRACSTENKVSYRQNTPAKTLAPLNGSGIVPGDARLRYVASDRRRSAGPRDGARRLAERGACRPARSRQDEAGSLGAPRRAVGRGPPAGRARTPPARAPRRGRPHGAHAPGGGRRNHRLARPSRLEGEPPHAHRGRDRGRV